MKIKITIYLKKKKHRKWLSLQNKFSRTQRPNFLIIQIVIIEPISQKLKTKPFNNIITFYLAYFWTIFLVFRAKFLLNESVPVTHNFIWVSSNMPNFRKIWWSNSMKTLGQTERWTDCILQDLCSYWQWPSTHCKWKTGLIKSIIDTKSIPYSWKSVLFPLL